MKHECKLPPFTAHEELNQAEIPWGVKHINAPQAWNSAKGEDVVVAILDTGCDASHPDLNGRVVDGRNFTTDYNGDIANYQDNQGHGTHCAGVIAGSIDNNGIIGVAPKAKLIIGKVLSGNGAGEYHSIVRGIQWATSWIGPNGETVRVISMSLGASSTIPALHQAIKDAVSRGIVVVCASGNSGDNNHHTDEYAYPGIYPEVIEVGATDNADNIATFSNTNDQIDVVAPGVDIISSAPGNRWSKMSGTSMATPHVAGMLAVLISHYEGLGETLTEPEIYELLLKHVRPLAFDKKAVGNGIIDFKAGHLGES